MCRSLRQLESDKTLVDAVASAESRNDFHLRWAGMGAPQRPPPQVVEAIRSLLAEKTGLSLQLGVTPEIAHVVSRSVALDNSLSMIRSAWPGDSEAHQAVLGDWLAMPLPDHSVDVAFGDGCLSVLRWPEEGQLLGAELRRVLRSGGRVVLRCFLGPDKAETLSSLKGAALSGVIDGFGAFKLRMNMAAYALSGDKENSGDFIYRLFQTHFPEREILAEALGTASNAVDAIDFYAKSSSIHSYPTLHDIVAVLPPGTSHRLVAVDGYPLSERCPLLVVDFP